MRDSYKKYSQNCSVWGDAHDGVNRFNKSRGLIKFRLSITSAQTPPLQDTMAPLTHIVKHLLTNTSSPRPTTNGSQPTSWPNSAHKHRVSETHHKWLPHAPCHTSAHEHFFSNTHHKRVPSQLLSKICSLTTPLQKNTPHMGPPTPLAEHVLAHLVSETHRQ